MTRYWICLTIGAAVTAGAGCGGTGDAEAIEAFVCGTDGETYSVEEAARDERDVAHRGPCDEPMPCESPTDCFVGDGCEPEAAGNDGQTVSDSHWCVPGPIRCNCPGVFEPVCGGDGRNYINSCEAACAGVAVRHEGYCEEPPGTGCVRAGCSDHLCVEEGADIASTCEWRNAYVCYQEATCARQQNGQCGFTPTYELVECLARHTGGCRDDGDCPEGQYCQPGNVWSPDGMREIIGDHPRPGTCMDLCALIDCAPGYTCELGQCVPQPCVCPDIYWPVCGVDGQTYGNGCQAECGNVAIAYEGECDDSCPVTTHVRTPEGQCEPKCYGPEQCGDEQHCNAAEVCLQDPACPACDVCVGWCEPPGADCRTAGCDDGGTCDYCAKPDGGAEWICLPPNAGACLPPDDCHPTGCNGEICAALDEDVASPCVALPEFECYRELGTCERQDWGGCGWTPTPELDMCLAQFDCRSEGCPGDSYCGFCWISWECIPEGAVC